METKIQREYIDTGLGFPIRLQNVPMIKVRGSWTPHVNYKELSRVVLNSLCFKSARLTGSEVKFIRSYFEMTLQDFAKRFDVSHVAVLKWEKSKNNATVMNWATEKDIRLFIVTKLNSKSKVLTNLYSSLESIPEKKSELISLNAENLAA